MPNQPKTPRHAFRIPPELYEAAQRKAARQGIPLSAAVRKCLERYVSEDDDDHAAGGK